MTSRRPGDDQPSRREQARRKAAALRAAELARERRRRTATISAVVAVVLVVVVGLGVAYQASRSGTSGPVAVPAGVSNGGVTVGQAGAPVTVIAYEDFQCPACKAFETSTAGTLASLRDSGKVKVVYKPIAFLDRASTTDYSSRALNAAACLLQEAPAGFQKLHDALFAAQPAENSAGLTDAQLFDMVKAAGAPNATSCINNRTYKNWVKQVTDQSSKDGVNQTPTIRVNGKDLKDTSPAGLQAAVTAAV